MSIDRAAEICALLLTQRVVERHLIPEIEEDLAVIAEVRHRLEQCGLTFVERTGISYLAVVVRQEVLLEETVNEMGLDKRALALILRVWLLLVAPFLYTGNPPPVDIESSTFTLETLALELQEGWPETVLKRYLSQLVHAKFLKHVHGRTQTYTAGPMLWLAIHHEVLIERLKRAAVPFTAERFRQLQREEEKEV